MHGNTMTRSLNALRHMAGRPDHAWKWLANRIHRKTPIEQGLPWFSYTAIEKLRPLLRPGMQVFEWGGGGSTVFFASHGCHVTTVESDRGWAELIRKKLSGISPELDARVSLRLVEAGPGDKAANERYVKSVLDGGPWDIIVVDGLEENFLGRMDCLRCLAQHPAVLSDGGLVVLDDAWRPEYTGAPSTLAGLQHVRNWGLGPIRWGVTVTDFFRK